MVNEGGKSPNVEIRVIFGEEAVIVREETRSLGETCAEPGRIVGTLNAIGSHALSFIRSHIHCEDEPSGPNLPAGYMQIPNLIPMPRTEPPAEKEDTSGLPN